MAGRPQQALSRMMGMQWGEVEKAQGYLVKEANSLVSWEGYLEQNASNGCELNSLQKSTERNK